MIAFGREPIIKRYHLIDWRPGKCDLAFESRGRREFTSRINDFNEPVSYCSAGVIICAATIVALAIFVWPLYASERISVHVIDRQDSANTYTYTLPGYTNTRSNTNVDCNAYSNNVNCSGTTTSSGTVIPARVGSYAVRGATLSIQLPDGRIVIVNCESKYQMKGDYVNRRSCRVPLVSDIQAEFDKDKAKLFWAVSIDGRKLQSETYKVVAVIDKR